MHGEFDGAEMHAVLFRTRDENDAFDIFDCAGLDERGQEVGEHGAVDVPVFLLGFFLQVRGEEDVFAADVLEVFGHAVGRGLQVNVVVEDVVGVVFLFAARERVDGGPLLAVLAQLCDDFAAEDAFEVLKGV